MKCPKCGYKWSTKSALEFVTCPNCTLKVRKTKKDGCKITHCSKNVRGDEND